MTEMNYVELSADAKETAMHSFIDFYVRQYSTNSLEILGAHVSNKVMATINQVLQENNFMGHNEQVAISYKLSKPAYTEILEQLTNIKFDEDGEPVVAWEQAWEDQEETLPEED